MRSTMHASLALLRPRLNGLAASRLAVIAVVSVVAVAVAAPSAKADFGFKDLGLSFSDEGGGAVSLAGSHPSAWTTRLRLNAHPDPDLGEVPDADLKDLRISLPPGLIGTPALLPLCSQDEFAAESCAAATAVGSIELSTSLEETAGEVFPLYNLQPPPGMPAEFGFTALHRPVTFAIGINPDPPYNLFASLRNVSQAASFLASVLTIYGTPGGRPFLTMPRSCGGPLAATVEADSWQDPGSWVTTEAEAVGPPGLSGCSELGFSPSVAPRVTTSFAQAPSGLDLSLDIDDGGLLSAADRAQSDLRRAVVALPEGITASPSLAEGLGTCTKLDLQSEAIDAAPGQGCPGTSKIGTVQAVSPLFEEPLAGSLFIAAPDNPTTAKPAAENPFDTLFAFYMVFRNPKLGVIVKQAARVEPDPRTGRLTVVMDDLPQLPFSHLELHFRDGPHAPLATPAACGDYDIRSQLTPWSGTPPLTSVTGVTIDRGCATGDFRPTLFAGTTTPVAGAASPFLLVLGRRDGEPNVAGFSSTLPPGLTAKFADVPLCPDALAGTGACPSSSKVGSVEIAAGVGSAPLSIPTSRSTPTAVYLAGPYRGAPFSFVAVVPAEAGPFDLGTVVTRAGIHLDPRTAQATIELDALPQILRGVPIEYRAVRLLVDRPGFVHNPTNCGESASHASVISSKGTAATASDRFEVGRCARLGFKPKVSLSLLGPTHRGAHPRLRTVLTSRRGDANLRRAAATLPATELLDNRHIGTVCTAAQFGAGKCPAGSVYGHAKAWTPLLDRPLEGPVYLRASKTRLPELVASLRGQIDLDLVSRIDSVGGRLRTTLQALPDAPLSKVVLTMRGGKRGLLVNTGGLCAGEQRASVGLSAQNGKAHHLDPVVKTDCGRKRK
jgi:hypothetical protein